MPAAKATDKQLAEGGCAVAVLALAISCCGWWGCGMWAGKKTPDGGPPRDRRSLPVQVLGARVERNQLANGGDQYVVCVDWKNASDRPVRSVFADIRVYDADGGLVDKADDYTIYAEWPGKPGIPAGGRYTEPTQDGHRVLRAGGKIPVRATATVTRAYEERID